ncbi:uncharacterized protein PF3D7_1120000 [Amia ocellicauda]|uniref:uncharacterized protein PF3D7_1120000 n=1 Tax=Amia ocellicauda TaxID=2972642 RepID=UPI003463DD0C
MSATQLSQKAMDTKRSGGSSRKRAERKRRPKDKPEDVSYGKSATKPSVHRDSLARSAACSPLRKVLNVIPTGKQLPRTPPPGTPALNPEGAKKLHNMRRNGGNQDMEGVPAPERDAAGERHGHDENLPGSDVMTQQASECLIEDPNDILKEPSDVQDLEEQREMREKAMRRRKSTLAVAAHHGEVDQEGMVKGMQGYEWTEADLEFVERMKNEKLLQQLKTELKILQKQLKDEQQKKDLSLAMKEKIQADFSDMSTSFDQTLKLGRAFLCAKLGTKKVKSLPPEEVISQMSVADIQHVCQEEKSKLQILQKEVEIGQRKTAKQVAQEEQLRVKKKLCEEEMEKQERRTLMAKENVDHMKAELSDLKSKLSESQEKLKSMKGQIETLKASKQMEALSLDGQSKEDVDMTKIVRRSKRIQHRKDQFLERDAILKRIRLPN